MAPLAPFTLSAFGDEIAPDLTEQLHVLQELKIGYLELRGVWDKNVLVLDDAEVARVRQLCESAGVAISAIGSPIGKSPLDAPLTTERNNLQRAIQIARQVGTKIIRIFSFYPPDTSSNAHYDQHVDAVVDRIGQLTQVAVREGIVLVLENESDIVGDTIDRCHHILRTIDSPALRFAWDPANFVAVGEDAPTVRGWPLLGAYTHHVHIKDFRLADRTIVPAGEGDGQVGLLLQQLQAANYQGFLALEPHLVSAGRRSGFSGPQGMDQAAVALRALLADTLD